MALMGISITKSVPFQGVGERFSNVYHYEHPVADEAVAAAFIQRLVDIETFLHSPIVSFVEGRVWSAGGTPAENQTILIQDLNAVGIADTDPHMYRENCWVMSWKTGRPSATGKPVHLRKFFHGQSQYAAVPIEDVTNGQQPLPAAGVAFLQDAANNIQNLVVSGGTHPLTAPSGRKAVNAAKIDPFLQSREFHN